MLDKLVRAFVTLSVGAWLARTLGPAAFGEYTYAITFVALFLGLANLGADGIVVRDMARNPGCAPQTLGTLLRLRLVTGAACWLLAVVAMHVTRPGDSRSLLLVAIVGSTLVLQSAETVDLWLQSQSQNKRAIIAKLAGYALGNAVRAGLILADAPLWAFGLSVAMDALLMGVALSAAYRGFPSAKGWRFDMDLGRSLVSQSWPFMLSGVAVLIYMRIDQIMIREMLGETQLGFYSSATVVSQMWYALPIALGVAFAPYVARKKEQGNEAYLGALMSIFRLFALLSLTVVVCTITFSKGLIQLLYGASYSAAAPVLAIHVVSNVFVFLGVAQSLWLVNEGFGRLTLYRTVMGAVVCVLGNMVLIPPFGVRGAACSTVFAMFVSAVGSNAMFAPRILRMQLRAIFLPWPFSR